MKNLLLLCVLFIACAACNNPAKNTAQAPLAENFYKRFEGTIGDKKVVMHLNKTGNDYNGTYYTDGAWLELLTDTLIGKDSIALFEMDHTDYYWDKNGQPKLSLKWVGDQLQGKWISRKKDTILNITLKETYPAGAEKFETIAFADSLAAFKGKKGSPKARFGFVFPKAENASLDIEIKKALKFKTADRDWRNGVDAIKNDFFTAYSKDASEEIYHNADSLGGSSLNYRQNTAGHIRYNDNGFVVIDEFRDNYTGGAHGYYYSTMLNFDVQQKKLLKLNDILNTDSLTLKKIMANQFRKQYNIKPDVDLNTALFVKEIPLTDNFYFNKNGLAFIYNPYEIASYAQGQIVVFIPFKVLRAYLLPDFAKRMHFE